MLALSPDIDAPPLHHQVSNGKIQLTHPDDSPKDEPQIPENSPSPLDPNRSLQHILGSENEHEELQNNNSAHDRMKLINHISSHLEENAHIFNNNNPKKHNRNNTMKENLNDIGYLQDYENDADDEQDTNDNNKASKQSKENQINRPKDQTLQIDNQLRLS